MLAAGTRLGRYEITAPLGAGAMGEVYRARDAKIERDVAIKVLPDEFARDRERLRRFEDEMRAAGRLNHTNILAIYDVGVEGEIPYVVTELLEGETLRARLRGGPLPIERAVDFAIQIAAGLAAAHDQGITHRDLKPENLFVTRDDRVKILDFGLAKLTRPDNARAAGTGSITDSLTETGVILGTAGYMAPEQVRGERADARSDLFAFGGIVYEMVAGRRAFEGSNHVETLYAILNQEPPPLSSLRPEVPPGLERIVRHCLEKRPERRFQSARDLEFALAGVAGSGAASAVTSTAQVPPVRPRVALIAAAALVLATVAGVAFVLGHRGATAASAAPRYMQITFERGMIGEARFGPDGNTVFYNAKWGGDPARIFDARLVTRGSSPLELPGQRLFSVSSRGELLVNDGPATNPNFEGSGTLSKVWSSGGAPRPWVDHVSTADWAPDGSAAAVVRAVGETQRLEMPSGHVLYESAAGLRHVRVSRDGKRVAFLLNPSTTDTHGCVAVVDLQGHLTRITREWGDLLGMAWSADGREVWYTAQEDSGTYGLFAATLDGKQRVIERFPGIAVLRDIAPDGRVLLETRTWQLGIRGRRIADPTERELGWLDGPMGVDISSDASTLLFQEFEQGGGAYQYSACIRGMDGSAPVRLGDGSAWSLSPDGRWVLAAQFGVPQKLVMLPTGSGEPRIIPVQGIDTYDWGTWLPDGRGVIFSGQGSKRPKAVYAQSLSDSMPRRVAPPVEADDFPVSLDGKWVAGVVGGRLMAYPLEGGTARAVNARWDPADLLVPGLMTSSGEVFAAHLGPDFRVDKISIETGERRHWKAFTAPDPAGMWMFGLMVARDEKAYAYDYVRDLGALFVVTGWR